MQKIIKAFCKSSFLIIFLVILLMVISCKKDRMPYRFIDNLSQNNVIQSPLINLVEQLKKVEQKLKTEEFFLLELNQEKNTYWAIPASFPLLGEDESKPPEGMKVINNNQELKFIGSTQKAPTGWSWTRMKQVIQPEIYSDYKEFAYKDWIILPKDKYFKSHDLYLPQGEVNFKIFAGSGKGTLYSPEVKIFLDNNLLKSFIINPRKIYDFSHTVKSGKHQIKIGFQTTKSLVSHNEKENLILEKIQISSADDLILIKRPPGNNKKKPSGNYQAIYSILKKNQKFHRLYQIQNGFHLLDLGSGENPYFIKKKVRVGNQTLNTIFAPPDSCFQFKLRIPESATLDFKYGLLKEAWTKKGDGVKFEIILHENGQQTLLFSKNLNPFGRSEERKIFAEKIDLSAYKNKKVKISFITNKNKTIVNDLSCWFNPVIFQNTLTGISNDKLNGKNNIIMISLDTLRADHLGCYGYHRNTSPNIDELAADSVLFERCYSHSPLTLPSHMSMLTSLYPISHKLYDNSSEAGLELDPNINTLADYVREINYLTGAITGGGWVSAKFGFPKGFDSYLENTRKVNDYPENLFKQAKNWINTYKNQNFFLFLHTYEIHGPYSPPSPYNKMFTPEDAKWESVDPYEILQEKEGQIPELTNKERDNLIALYDGEIRYTDECLIKPLIKMLKETNIYNRTMIILTSDHGEEFYEHQGWLHFDTLYEEVLHIPLIIKLPKSQNRKKRIRNVTREIDIGPTILDILNINFSGSHFDGNSLAKMIGNKEKESRLSIGYKFIPRYNNQHNYVFLLQRISAHTEGYKLILNEKESRQESPPFDIELYNLKNDPKEQNNLAAKETKLKQRLVEIIRPYYLEAKKTKNELYQKGKLHKELEERLKALGYIK